VEARTELCPHKEGGERQEGDAPEYPGHHGRGPFAGEGQSKVFDHTRPGVRSSASQRRLNSAAAHSAQHGEPNPVVQDGHGVSRGASATPN
jgi:hypothetical protein